MTNGVVCVSGGSGVVGAAITRGLLAAGHRAVEASDSQLPAEASVLVHVRTGPSPEPELLSTLLEQADQEGADQLGVEHVVVVSSACVYGAWPDNPVPITEASALKPNPGTAFAVRHAQAEAVALRWAVGRHEGSGAPPAGPSGNGTAGRGVAVLRPAPVVGSPVGGALGETVLAVAPIRTGRDDPPAQFLHMADLVSAVVLAVERRLSGVFNVAPDGWLEASELRALLGARPKLRLPVAFPAWLDRYVARRLGHRSLSGFLPYTQYPWVVSNQHLREQGWRPRYGNDQAFVLADEAMPWDDMSALQRQRVSLLLGAVLAVALLGGAGFALRWLLRRARQSPPPAAG